MEYVIVYKGIWSDNIAACHNLSRAAVRAWIKEKKDTVDFYFVLPEID